MKIKFAIVLLILLTTCAPARPVTPSPVPTAIAPPPSTVAFTAIPTFTPAPIPTTTPQFQLGNDGKTVVYDFAAHLCEANWMTGVKKDLPCPGDLNNPSLGYVGLLSGTDQGLAPDFPLVLTFPAYDASSGRGLFGRFPKFQVGPNDEFRTAFTCRSGFRCEVEFTLGYYDANGKYYEPFPLNYYRFGVEPPINYVQPLNSLSGQTVELVLVVRAMYQSDPTLAWGLWIAPRILRP